ncbi:MAG: S-adenosylmethionine:tRNA ribosyltransferase-isomerase, partial [bacterium]|nr:S-adenosylmethionine:tRNA ribosyltransferase-isomerase [bacterium]
PYQGSTSLYIMPGHRFGAVDLLLTNFHMPGSSLLVLVAAFVGESWRSVYKTARKRGYRFLSFGDAMLLERAPTPVGSR